MTVISGSARIIQGIGALRLNTLLREYDRAWAVTGEIRYFIDADVYSFLADPKSKRRLAAIFYGDALHSPAVIATAFAAAEYLSSGMLRGQGSQKLYIAEPHLAELGTVSSTMSRTPGAQRERFDKRAVRNAQQEFSVLATRASQSGFEKEEVRLLTEKAAQLIDVAVGYPFASTLALRRLKENERIEAASHANDLYRRIASTRSQTEIDEWRARLACALDLKKFRSVREGLDRLAKQDLLKQAAHRRDAQVLSDLVRLNRESDDACVLISGARTMHVAYNEWWIQNADHIKPTSRSYLLRHPAQYIPLVNPIGYADGFSLHVDIARHASVLADISSSLNAFLDPVFARPSFDRIVRILNTVNVVPEDGDVTELRGLERQLEWQDAHEIVEETVDDWRLAYANATLGVLEVLQRRSKAQLDIFVRALEGAGNDIIVAQETLVSEIEFDHLELSIVGLGIQIREEIDQFLRVYPEIGNVRPLLPLLIDGGSFLPGGAEQSELTGPLSGVISLAERTYQNSPSQAGECERALAGACVALALGAWEQAKRFAYRGLQGIERGCALPVGPKRKYTRQAVKAELDYLQALAIRYDCRSRVEFDVAMDLLNVQGMGVPTDYRETIRNVRSLVERAILQLTAAIRQFSIGKGFSRTWPSFHRGGDLGSSVEYLRGGLEDLEEANNILDNFVDRDESDVLAARSERLIAAQIRVNLVVAFNLHKLLSCDVPVGLLEKVLLADVELEQDFVELKHRHEIAEIQRVAFRIWAGYEQSRLFEDQLYLDRMIDKAAHVANNSMAKRVYASSDFDYFSAYEREFLKSRRLEAALP